MSHYQEICEFGKVHGQCRCPSKDKHTQMVICDRPSEHDVTETLTWSSECGSCSNYKPGDFFPPHTASTNCQSGRRNHCTCDTCF